MQRVHEVELQYLLMLFFLVFGVLIDAFTDPAFAQFSDNYVSKFGRRKPFLLISAVFTPVIFVLGFLGPPMAGGWNFSTEPNPDFYKGRNAVFSAVYFGFFHIMFKLSDTITMIPQESMGTELTPNYVERTRIWTWRFLVDTFNKPPNKSWPEIN